MKNELPKLRNNIPALARRMGMDRRTFLGGMVALDASVNTAKKLWDGHTEVNQKNAQRAALVLGVKYQDVITE
jgi:hypothetical protein